MIENRMYKKMLSHRLRGYSEYEHSPSALQKACSSPVRYLELDSRASKDGQIFIHHDYKTSSDFSQKIYFSEELSSEINKARFLNGEKIMTLEEALSIFSSSRQSGQKICLDIKDFGYEKTYLELVRKYKLENQVVFVSWIPQVLINLSSLGTKEPLILSHWNSIRFQKAGEIITNIFRNVIAKVLNFVILGKNNFNVSLLNYASGYQHTILLHELPAEILNVLSASKGGICVHKFIASKSLLSYCRKNGLELWVFSVSKKEEFYKYAKKLGVDVVFCDTPIH